MMPHRAPFTMQQVYCHTGNLVMNVPMMPLHLVHLASSPVITLLHAGFVITVIPLPVLVLATTLVRSGKNA